MNKHTECMRISFGILFLSVILALGILYVAKPRLLRRMFNLKEIHIPRGSLEHYVKIMLFYKDKFVEE